MNLAINRTVVSILTNSSGGNLAYGSVVVLSASQESFTTTTTSGFSNGVIGVIIEPNGIANGAMGKVATAGYVKQINLSSAATLGDLVKAHTVAGQGVRHASPRVTGDFAQVLDDTATPPAILFGSPTPTLNSVLNDYILIEDQKASGTAGGSSTQGSWETRTLNTEVHDSGGHASVASNQITLAAGTYRFCISAPAYQADWHKAKLYNVTDAADVKLGSTEFNDQANIDAITRSWVKGEFTIATSKVFEVRHQVRISQATDGYGIAASFGTEVYTQAEFWKVA